MNMKILVRRYMNVPNSEQLHGRLSYISKSFRKGNAKKRTVSLSHTTCVFLFRLSAFVDIAWFGWQMRALSTMEVWGRESLNAFQRFHVHIVKQGQFPAMASLGTAICTPRCEL